MYLIEAWSDFWDTVRHLGFESVTVEQFIFMKLFCCCSLNWQAKEFTHVNLPYISLSFSLSIHSIEYTTLLWGVDFIGTHWSAAFSHLLCPAPCHQYTFAYLLFFCRAQTMPQKQSCETCGPQQTNHFGADGLITDAPSPDECRDFLSNSADRLHLDTWKQVANTTFSAVDLAWKGWDNNQQRCLLFLFVLAYLIPYFVA